MKKNDTTASTNKTKTEKVNVKINTNFQSDKNLLDILFTIANSKLREKMAWL
jgi:hypothetical protein